MVFDNMQIFLHHSLSEFPCKNTTYLFIIYFKISFNI